MRILLVEDDNRIAQPLADDLRHQYYYVVDLAYEGIEGWDCSQSAMYDLTLPITRRKLSQRLNR